MRGHVTALSLGPVAGVCTLAGIALPVRRRRTGGPVFSAPVGYLFRPYVLYRTRDAHAAGARRAERAGCRGR